MLHQIRSTTYDERLLMLFCVLATAVVLYTFPLTFTAPLTALGGLGGAARAIARRTKRRRP
jgi:hypothetical protein